MALTIARYDTIVNDEWQGGTWPAKGGGRPRSIAREPIRAHFAELQGGMCPVLGIYGKAHPIVNGEFNHTASAKSGLVKMSPKGFIDGNVFTGCKACNAWCAGQYGFDVTDDEGKTQRNGGVIPFDMLDTTIIGHDFPDITPFLRSKGLIK